MASADCGIKRTTIGDGRASRRVSGAIAGISRHRARGHGIHSCGRARDVQATAGRHGVGRRQGNVGIFAAGGIRPIIRRVDRGDIAVDVVIGRARLQSDQIATPGIVGMRAIGEFIALFVLKIHAAIVPLEIGRIVQVDIGGDGRGVKLTIVGEGGIDAAGRRGAARRAGRIAGVDGQLTTRMVGESRKK